MDIDRFDQIRYSIAAWGAWICGSLLPCEPEKEVSNAQKRGGSGLVSLLMGNIRLNHPIGNKTGWGSSVLGIFRPSRHAREEEKSRGSRREEVYNYSGFRVDGTIRKVGGLYRPPSV